jgi:hypothetical protein
VLAEHTRPLDCVRGVRVVGAIDREGPEAMSPSC